MHPSLPIARIGYTLHVIAAPSDVYIARLLRPDGCVVSEWTTRGSQRSVKHQIARLRESIEESLSDKASLPIYYGKIAESPVVVSHTPMANGLGLSTQQ